MTAVWNNDEKRRRWWWCKLFRGQNRANKNKNSAPLGMMADDAKREKKIKKEGIIKGKTSANEGMISAREIE